MPILTPPPHSPYSDLERKVKQENEHPRQIHESDGNSRQSIIVGVTALVLIVLAVVALVRLPPHNVSTQKTSAPSTKTSTKPVDGKIASMKQIDRYQSYTGTDVKLYQLFYWSHGYKVEAFLTEPSTPGKYPLLVNMHGGDAWSGSHALLTSVGYTAQQAAHLASTTAVIVYPEYEGYMGSQGNVMGIKTDTLDVENAIAAATSLGEVKSQDTYLIGFSLGGALAFMVAESDHNVRAVVAVSPFVGLKDFVTWANTHAKPETITDTELIHIGSAYGYNVNSAAYKERSPDVTKINAPVLLLQGTGDQRVPWQTVQLFANQMKAAHKDVKLVLYPGGQHGLHDQYQQAATEQIAGWFKKYGLNYQP